MDGSLEVGDAGFELGDLLVLGGDDGLGRGRERVQNLAVMDRGRIIAITCQPKPLVSRAPDGA